MKRALIALPVLAVLLLAGCSSESTPPKEPSSDVEPSAVDTPTAEAVSVERWAGLVAERKLETDDWYASWDDAICSSMASTESDCNLMLLTATFIALSNDLVIAGPSDPSAKTYLGPVPDEISDLYAETIDLTAAAVSAGDAWSDADCGVGDEGDCVGLAFEFESAMDAVRKKFAAWSPYL